MNVKKMKRTRLMGCVLAVVMVVSMMLSAAISTSAAPANQSVTDAKNGVVQIQVWFNDPETATAEYLQYGTGFLINDTTVVTCQHVVTAFSDDFYVEWAKTVNKATGQNRTAAEIKACLELRVMVLRDVYVTASVKQASTEMDYAILTLQQSVNNRTPLSLRDSSSLEQTEEVFALGFPGDMDDLTAKHNYDANDVTITSGNVNKVADLTFTTVEGTEYKNVNCVESSALITGGNSGGPLVDANGAVVGINAAGNNTRNLAVSSKQLIDVLEALGIAYTAADEVTNNTTTEPSNTTTEAGESTTTTTEAESVPTTQPTQAANDKDEKDEDEAAGGLDTTTLIIIGVGAVVLILIIVLIVVLGGKKKAPAAPAAPAQPMRPAQPMPPVQPMQPVRPAQPMPPVQPMPPAPPVRPAQPMPPVTPGTTVLAQDAGATTVLGQNAGATTVLSQNVNGGSLVRVSSNERVPICTADFTVGRERNSVDYCIAGNSNVSRVHARFVVRDGKTYIVDNKAANGTFVNGVKCRPGQEIELNNGDKITLADEKFEFNK